MNNNRIQKRLNAITTLIKQQAITDQETLVELLNHEYNIDTTQSIISKDLRKLGISKRTIGSTMAYELPTIDATQEILRRAIVAIDHNETTIVIRTLPGLAAFVADYIDAHATHDILGTIAGENTILVTPCSIQKITTTFKTLCERMHIKKAHTQGAV